MKRRAFLVGLGAAACGIQAWSLPALADDGPTLRIGLTSVFLDDQALFLLRWRDYLQGRLGTPVVFVQRSSYREISELLTGGELDVAWICGYPYLGGEPRMRLLAVPLYEGEPLYRSFLIVPAADTATRSLEDLDGRVFAFSDPDSNSGFLYTQHQLLQLGRGHAGFFARTFFTWSHRKVIEAVAVGMAQGGAVDGYVWDTLKVLHPELTGLTRVVAQSPPFGFPPFVARHDLALDRFEAVRGVLMGMHMDAEGAELLEVLNLDGFTTGSRELFASIERMAAAVQPR